MKFINDKPGVNSVWLPADRPIKVGINGKIGDAIMKSYVLQHLPEASVTLYITPMIATLKSWFERVKSVKEVILAQTPIPVHCWGEQSPWLDELDIDTTFPYRPLVFVPNYVAVCTGFPRTTQEKWKGSYNYLVPKTQRQPQTEISVYVDITNDPENKKAEVYQTLSRHFPDIAIKGADPCKTFYDNMVSAVNCNLQIVAFSGPMVALTALGETPIVIKNRFSLDTFICGEDVIQPDNLSVDLQEVLLKRL